MDKISPAVLDAFEIHRIIKKVKGYYICQTSDGFTKIHISSESPWEIYHQHSFKEHLAINGFVNTDRFLLTKSGQPFITVGRESYVMTNYLQHQREIDYLNDDDVLVFIDCLARFHMSARAIKTDSIPINLVETYNRNHATLQQSLKQARRSPRLSDFDVLFIKHAHYYTEIIQNSMTILSESNYKQLLNDAVTHGHLCHNALKEENLLFTDADVYITNFQKAGINLQLNDLAAFINRYALRSNKNIPICHLLKQYDKISPLPQGAADILYALLIFPQQFIKIITQCYSKKRNWTPNGLLNRMQSIIDERESYEEYVNTIKLQF